MGLIALGVSGGIGAYKAVEVCRGLQKRGHDVVAVMTRAATRFVGPLTFEAITRRPVITSQWKAGANADIEHIAIADEMKLLLVAPCTANVIGKFANGIADDFLTSLYLATKAPVLIAPAMNTNMLEHPAVQRNLETLAARGTRFVDPGEGYLACGWIGKGRLAEPEDIVAAAERVLAPANSSLRNRRVVVTAGPTYEDIDPVRYVGNRSSGRMGFALAAEAYTRGARVTLVAGPTHLEPPTVSSVVNVRSAAEMHEAVMRASEDADVVIMAAAVADYAPTRTASGKIEKSDAPLTLTLQRTPDILADLGRTAVRRSTPPILVGFAAETGDPIRKARDKRVRKNADLIVANDVSAPGAGFDVSTNAVTIVSADGEEALPLQSKAQVAVVILDRVEQIIRTRTTVPSMSPTNPLEDHLEFFEELGIDGVRLEPAWRSRASASPRAPDSDDAPAPQAAAPAVLFLSPSDALAAIRHDLGDCVRCKLHTLGRRQIVFGVGNPDADLMFVGEAPGADEDVQGEPFVGRAGQLLTKIIEAIELKREDVYIANVIKCRPPGNRNPEPDEVEQCEPFLFRQIDTIKPKVIVALGKFGAQCLLRTTDPITRLRGREFKYRDAILIPTYHPAYLLRTPSAKRDVWEDMKKVRAILKGNEE